MACGPVYNNANLQIEFYFSDSNAPRDKFLLEKIKSHPEVNCQQAQIKSCASFGHLHLVQVQLSALEKKLQSIS